MGSTPQERAAALHSPFADPSIKAVFATTAGAGQISVLPHLVAALITASPTPFFGHSDNTNLLVWLANRGVVGSSGGSVMVQFGRRGAMHPTAADSLRAALFTPGE